MERWNQGIGSDKVVKPLGYDENRSIADEIINGNQMLQLTCLNISDGWHIWAGLVIQNDGTVPTSVEKPIIQMLGAYDHQQSFSINTYFYGPFEHGGYAEV
ncbi:hypothetical protein KEJ19_07195 [Candidatus Bathyarchaeota archaeon]|nr:hypothetical protein [Candidatus Bathyarchaeota archaeon]